MLEALFRYLFKYRPVVFERGDLVFDPPWPIGVVVAVGIVVGGLAIAAYARTAKRVGRRDRTVLAALRLGAIAVLVFCLTRPILVIATVVPQQNFLGVLIDDSQSMRITDADGRARSEFVREQFAPEEGRLLTALSDRFKLRLFRFSEGVRRLGSIDELSYAGERTDLGRALGQAHRELGAVPLAGLIVVSDGAHNAGQSLTDALLQLQASGVPVYTVGVGLERFKRDIELRRADAPHTVLKGSSIAVDLTFAQSGFDGETVQLTVEDAGRIVQTREIRFSGDDEAKTVRVHFEVSESGPRLFRFRVAPQSGETVRENNVLETLIVVEDATRKILYFEGEPRFEVKFIRRAIAEDENLRVVTLQRTAEDKFYRLDVDDPEELAGGFPRTREELFRYHGLILGSVEASFFTHDQLRMINEFIEQRGGGLLALGGRLAFERGGYAHTPLADALPVVIDEPEPSDTSFFADVKVGLTQFGRTHAVTQLHSDAEASEARWRELPELSTLNRVTQVKPGASTLLTGRTSDRSEPLVVLAYQRYGRGKAIVFPVQDSWLWQMHADIPLDDLTHETLWRQLLRWLVSDVPDRVSVVLSTDRVEAGTAVAVTALVTDSGYVDLNGAEVMATVTSPSGDETAVPMEWTVERDGEYRARFVPTEEGLHEIRVEARQGQVFLGEGEAYVQVGDLAREYFDATMRAPLLRRIAEETGGRFYTPQTIATLPEDVSFTESGATVYEERDLWDMPLLLILLLGLVGAEWVYRRRRGLA